MHTKLLLVSQTRGWHACAPWITAVACTGRRWNFEPCNNNKTPGTLTRTSFLPLQQLAIYNSYVSVLNLVIRSQCRELYSMASWMQKCFKYQCVMIILCSMLLHATTAEGEYIFSVLVLQTTAININQMQVAKILPTKSYSFWAKEPKLI